MSFYRRNLPHWYPEAARLFLTWRLHGSFPRGTVTLDCALGVKPSPGKQFVRADRLLDRSMTGPKWLGDPKVAKCIVKAIERGAGSLHQYQLHAFVVMPNHVHLLITPTISVDHIMRSLKGASSCEANRILDRAGKPFWQDESYDHWVRTGEEFGKIRSYIEWNPVSAGLVAKPEAWPWTSAGKIPW
jgi:putative transposase